jgi:hypothetical protein
LNIITNADARYHESSIIVTGFLLLQERSPDVATVKEEIKEEMITEEHSLMM